MVFPHKNTYIKVSFHSNICSSPSIWMFVQGDVYSLTFFHASAESFSVFSENLILRGVANEQDCDITTSLEVNPGLKFNKYKCDMEI